MGPMRYFIHISGVAVMLIESITFANPPVAFVHKIVI